MTPLAQEIVRRVAGRYNNPWPELERSDCRCFEVTAVRPLMHELYDNRDWFAAKEQLGFLPAPITWVEWHEEGQKFHEDGRRRVGRVGVLFTAVARGTVVDIEGVRHTMKGDGFLMRYCVRPNGDMPHPVEGCNPIALYPDETGELVMAAANVLHRDNELFFLTVTNMRLAIAALALINSPRIVGRKTHLPHAGLQREMARARKMVGKFPLQAWTEITLDLTPPKEAQDDGHEAHLTGGRALHFCRAHLRVRLGKLEYVRHHWRGDPSVGIKQSRYVVKPPRTTRDLAVA